MHLTSMTEVYRTISELSESMSKALFDKYI